MANAIEVTNCTEGCPSGDVRLDPTDEVVVALESMTSEERVLHERIARAALHSVAQTLGDIALCDDPELRARMYVDLAGVMLDLEMVGAPPFARELLRSAMTGQPFGGVDGPQVMVIDLTTLGALSEDEFPGPDEESRVDLDADAQSNND